MTKRNDIQGPLAPLDTDSIAPEVHGTEKRTTAALRLLGRLGLVFARTFRLFFTAHCDKRESWRMAHRFTNGSLAFIVVSMAFVGMIMVYQSTEQLARAVGDTTLVGASFLKLLVRVLGPTVIGMLLACRVGAGIAAEIGAMAVTDQLDAMRMSAADPIETLMVPRLRGGLIASLALVIIGSFSAVLAGLATSRLMYGMAPGTYFNFSMIQPFDVVQGIAKSFSYGVAVPIISGAFGLFARGGARGVGEATTAAVVGSSFAIVLLDSLISMAAHILEGL
ncbi:MAG: ABC transporter permease [Myxococcales bacterium]|jgi:phospholipid/cholesterol/gamma-HCH transport system permease protein|nr:ABC transporter permease [Myxococcales bacterium]